MAAIDVSDVIGFVIGAGALAVMAALVGAAGLAFFQDKEFRGVVLFWLAVAAAVALIYALFQTGALKW